MGASRRGEVCGASEGLVVITVRMAESSDQSRLLEFIRDHWSPQHVFVERPEVFRWQHLHGSSRLNMVIAEADELGDPVLGVLGFIPMGRFDATLGDKDVMLAIWKVRDSGAPPGLGLQLLKYLQAQLRPRLIAAIGTSQMVRPIYRALRYEVGVLGHAALLHPGRAGRLSIADRVPGEAFLVPKTPGRLAELVPFGRASVLAVDRLASTGLPTKSHRYLVERYLQHPWYRYEVRAVVVDGDVVSVVVWRKVQASNTSVLRVVDIIGPTEWLPYAEPALRREVVGAEAEYLDIMHWGVDDNLLRAGGFVTRSDYPDMVLPTYFAPFEQQNVDIELAYRVFDSRDLGVRLFRADSDQDRPNQVSEIDGTG